MVALCILALSIWSCASASAVSNEVSQPPSRRHMNQLIKGAAVVVGAVLAGVNNVVNSPCAHCYRCKCWKWSKDCSLCRHPCQTDCRAVYNQNGQWSQWHAWTACSVTCARGVQTRVRSCDNPKPANGGMNCRGSKTQTTHCNAKACPIAENGHWGHWHAGTCSVTCGGGVQTYVRSCDNPKPANGGKGCRGPQTQTTHCNTQACPTAQNGHWSHWHAGTACSVTCGGGIQTRVRSCDNPKPANGGKNCKGSQTETVHCNTQACPIHVTTSTPVHVTTSTPVHVTSPVPVNNSTCLDTYPHCSTLGKSVCSGGSLYTIWSKQYCAAYCGFCVRQNQPKVFIPQTAPKRTTQTTPITQTTNVQTSPQQKSSAATSAPCVDKYSDCKSLSRAVCTTPANTIWSKQYCQAYCGFCTHP